MSLIVIANNISDPINKKSLVKEDGTADYDVEVSLNRRLFIWTGEIKNYKRDEGAANLLRLIADKIDEYNKSRG